MTGKKQKPHQGQQRKQQSPAVPQRHGANQNPPKPKGGPNLAYGKTSLSNMLSRLRVTEEVPPQNIIAATASAAGVVGNTKEIEYKANRYFDCAPTAETPVTQCFFNLNQADGPSAAPVPPVSGNTLSRPTKVEVWVLPRAANASVASGTYSIICGVTAVTPGITQNRTLTNVQTTTIKPDFNVEWIKAFYVNYERLFGDALIVPFVVEDFYALFGITAVNPDDGTLETAPFQVRYKVTYRQVLPAATTLRGCELPVKDWETGGDPLAKDQFAQIQPMKLCNVT